ncbi:tripartite tricarboxylate transporter TctB family protein [Thalassospira lucentensis]|uniref:tripartite tricarboxylate transporter TctB family protein n=1 Tax=Thalassospira lucentensis TaxID=168935 RepID=UPI003D2F134F
MTDPQLTKKRRADFFTSILLLVLSIAMLAETLTFPMADSYGGVSNVWYVSPALFPLLVSGLLIVMALILMSRAIRDGGMAQAIEDLPNFGRFLASENLHRLLVLIGIISAYVYALVPNIDFWIASFAFLTVLIAPFYIDDPRILRPLFGPFVVVSIIVFAIGRDADVNGTLLDAFVLIGAIFQNLIVATMSRTNQLYLKKWRISVMSAFLTPLVLVPCFKFGLLVPLPVEGIVINAMADFVRAIGHLG